MRNSMKAAVKCVLATLLLAAAVLLLNARFPDEVHSAVPGSKARDVWVAEDEVITLVVHSAPDCKYCVRWKGPFAGEGHFKSWARTHPGTQLFIVERASIASNEKPEDYPQELRWLSEQNQKAQRLRPGTPMFEVFVAQNLVLRSYGLDSWDEDVFPAVKDLDARRTHRAASR
ncbi:hypothetical protein NOV72_06151 [Caballeronia novacaledonica]|uniref:Thioredoxin-like fold domain-containing protein n=1 Tax=Caballeronia novacaledonica TaxID=1544861 RepID=A0A2U3IFF7_9BURK|nr:hypothetical protein [Caballeronia novacaledonica]SPB18946.1 hypothetical protein NOV72_06151 [Caballeronia novacaledonica]